jgi:hypothetical protein
VPDQAPSTPGSSLPKPIEARILTGDAVVVDAAASGGRLRAVVRVNGAAAFLVAVEVLEAVGAPAGLCSKMSG